MARAAGGRLLLRIEDIDPTRCRPEFEAAIYEDLAWLGIVVGRAGVAPVGTAGKLSCSPASLEDNGLIYPSFRKPRRDRASRRSARARRAKSGRAILMARRFILGSGAQDWAWTSAKGGSPRASPMRCDSTWRRPSRVPANCRGTERDEAGAAKTVAAAPAAWGDVVLGRKETPTSYHLSVVVDDALQGVTHVVRGRDLARCDQRPSRAAGAARVPGARSTSSQADPRCRRPRSWPSRPAQRRLRTLRGRGMQARRYSPHRRPGVIRIVPAIHGMLPGASRMAKKQAKTR